ILLCVVLFNVCWLTTWSGNTINPTWGNTIYRTEIDVSLSEAIQNEADELHIKSGCKKPENAQNHTICETLPVLSVKCGKFAKKREFDENGKKYRVPNIIHLVRIGDIPFDSLVFLTLRSMASVQQPENIYIYYSTTIPTGKFVDRAMKEIPCLNWVKVKDPEYIKGVHISVPDTRTDIIRFTKLL
uniref:Fucosyltransferase N-terminal domain-containing protein n=1 Tax=Ciona savignyi TaxID=51511 RepID=H2YFY9_CIOSA